MSDLSTHTLTIKKPFNGWLETNIPLLDLHVYLFVGSAETMRASLNADKGCEEYFRFLTESLRYVMDKAYKALEDDATFFPISESGSEHIQYAVMGRVGCFNGTVDSVCNLAKACMDAGMRIAAQYMKHEEDKDSFAMRIQRFLLREFLDMLQTKGHVPLLRSWHGGCELKYLAP